MLQLVPLTLSLTCSFVIADVFFVASGVDLTSVEEFTYAAGWVYNIDLPEVRAHAASVQLPSGTKIPPPGDPNTRTSIKQLKINFLFSQLQSQATLRTTHSCLLAARIPPPTPGTMTF